MAGALAAGVADKHRYHFNCIGSVKEIIYPNKAILHFKLNGVNEKAILLSKMLTLDGKPIEDNKLMQDIIKVNDVIHFDCHVYDKGGGMGSGKDRCNFFAMRAWKNTPEYELRNGTSTSSGLINVTSTGLSSLGLSTSARLGTGWVSELNPRKGVLTFDNNGKDERVLFLASKVYFFEKRIGARQPLTDFLSEGDPVQFEAVPQDTSGNTNGSSVGSDDPANNSSNSYCTWFANLVWKGKRPPVDSTGISTPPVPTLPRTSGSSGALCKRRDSCDSSSSSEYNCLNGGGADECVSYGTQRVGSNPDIIKGVGMIAKVVNDKSGILWWVKKFNQFQSVWFTSNKTFLYGTNLATKNLTEIFSEGDPVTFVAEKASTNCPTKWIAKQVLISDDTANLLHKATEPPDTVRDDVKC